MRTAFIFLFRYWSPLLLLTLALLACRAGERVQTGATPVPVLETPAGESTSPALETAADTPADSPFETESTTPEAGVTSTPPQAPTPVGEVQAPPASGRPPQSQAAEIQPPELREKLTRLSSLVGFQVIARDGSLLGTVSDYIINTCETYIIYFVMEPTAELHFGPGDRLIIPLEVVTINSGVFDAQAKTITLQLTADQLTGAPAFPESLALVPTRWEAEVRAYFSPLVRLSNLMSECRVAAPSTSGGETVVVYKIAYATSVLGAELQDGLRNGLGRVEEAILEPESGKLGFFVIHLNNDQGLVLVPLRVVNIPQWALEPGNAITLVLLTENHVLHSAPRIDSVEDATGDTAQNAARQYWNR